MLTLENIYKSFDDVSVLNGVNIHLERGKVYTLRGGNGSGKTTLFNIISGFVRPSIGVVRFRGREMSRFSPYRINRLGIGRTFQDLRLATQMTVRENLLLALEKGKFTFSSKKQREKADDLMERLALQNNIKEGGSIIIMSSNDAYPGAYASMSYSISKSALISLMKCLCVNYGNKNVRVNSVAPGAVNTDMNTPAQMELSPQYTPIKRVAQPAEVASVVFFLCSDAASFVNGENITIDGGYNIVSVLLKSEADSLRAE